MQKFKLIQVLQTVRPTFFGLIKEAREIGETELIDLWTYQTLVARGFQFEVVLED